MDIHVERDRDDIVNRRMISRTEKGRNEGKGRK